MFNCTVIFTDGTNGKSALVSNQVIEDRIQHVDPLVNTKDTCYLTACNLPACIQFKLAIPGVPPSGVSNVSL